LFLHIFKEQNSPRDEFPQSLFESAWVIWYGSDKFSVVIIKQFILCLK